MKIGIVCYPTLGGSGIVATELGHELALAGHEVHFITYDIPFRLRLEEESIYFHEVEINQYDLFKYPDYALTLAVKIANISAQYELDILHVHYAIPHATSAYLAKQLLGTAKPAVITTLHGTDITLVGRDPAYTQMVKFSIEKSCGVTAVSEDLRAQTLKSFEITRPIEVIHNFFIPRLDLMGERPYRSCFVDPDEKLILHSSNFRDVKRPQDVIQIFCKVRKQVKSKLVLLGTGSGLEAIRQLVRENQLQDAVFFVGKSRTVDPYVASADLFLLPSEQESFGVVALEAMAYGVPVIATQVGGLPEVITQGVGGYLCDVGDVDTMADHAIKILQNRELWQLLSEGGKRIAQEKFSVAKILPQYLNYYTSILEKSS